MLAPATFAEASRRLRDLGPRASLMAGGTDLVPRFKRRQILPEVVVSLHRVKGSVGIRAEQDGLSIGAGTTLAQVASDPLISRYSALRQAAESAATPQIRSIATIGGNLCLPPRCSYYDRSALWRGAQGSCLRSGSGECHVAPGASRCMAVHSGDLAPALLALGARARLVCGSGERVIPIQELFVDDGIAPLAKKPEEVLAGIHIGRAEGRSVYLKLRRRSSFDYPSLGVAVSLESDGRARECRIALGGVGPAPVVAHDAGRLLVGGRLEPDVVAAAASVAARLVRPVENSDFTASYRKRMAAVFVARALNGLREPTGLS
ncbi:MAG: FAD binding domain-containing protein [Elusimicrobia bacterium]|nr:FAD binding domain-containing protein [Elusimicrobiota bacterium]